MAEQCSKKLVGGWNFHQCSNPGKRFEEGQWWCNIHAPSKKKDRQDKRNAEWEREWAEVGKRDAATSKAAAIQRAKVETFDRIMEAREYEENAAYPPGSYTHGVIEEEHDRIANLIEEN